MKLWAVLAVIAIVMAEITFAQDGAERKQQSLCDRLGGLAPISVVVSDFIDALAPDAVVNANPAIDAARKRVPTPYLKYHLTALVCQATGGPCQYQGRGMKESHTDLKITEREWDRARGGRVLVRLVWADATRVRGAGRKRPAGAAA
jgi:hemoglobin